MKIILISLLILYLLEAHTTQVIPVKDPNNILITFGSCNRYYGDEPDDIFYKIADMNSDVWIWLGDVAYVDEKIMPPIFGFAGEEKIKKTLNSAKNSPPYVKLRETTNIIGVWDDHDFGLNNAGASFRHKDLTQQLWLDFMDEPADSPRRTRKGVYESYYIGDSSKIKVILLDVRYFKQDTSILKPNGTDLLGSEQWEWLENELKNNKAEYVLIGSGIQVLPDDRMIPEHWYSGNRDKLLALIRKYKVNGVMLLSGDVYYAEIMKYPCKEHVGYDLYEFTSSGLTHHVATHVPLADRFVNTMFPKTWNDKKQRFIDWNFGVLKFDFGKEKGVKLEIRDAESRVVLEQSLGYEETRFNSNIINEKKECIANKNKYARFFGNYIDVLISGEWYAYLVTLLISLGIWIITKIIKGLFKLVRMCFGKPKHEYQKVGKAE